MAQPLNFQQIIMKLHDFWQSQDCVLWQPYNIQVGAGTGNPATLMRVLGPEPWRVAYVEPSVRPDDGRYGENPNRMQYYYQYQVILKPDPGNPQEMYLQSLEALGINPREHDIRFVEDNWESPALGAWGLGWEVWLDGQEITQFTYFQQAGGIELNPVAVEITYGLERIALPLQGKDSVWQINWLGEDDPANSLLYGDILLQSEIEHCKYYFEVADVDGLRQTYDVYEAESKRALEAGLVIPAYDYVLKCSHLFNVLDTRGAIGVTERASYFRRMRDMTRKVSKAFAEQRQGKEYPLSKLNMRWSAPVQPPVADPVPAPTTPADFLFELGVEELPADDVDAALAQLETAAPKLFESLRLTHDGVQVYATPRRLVIHARQVAPRQPDREVVSKGPSADRAFDASGAPTKAAEGFARGKGITADKLERQSFDGVDYVVARVNEIGRSASDVLAEALPALIAGLKFGKSMRWNSTGIAFSRPIRWITALLGDAVIPFSYADVHSGRQTRGLRPYGSLEQEAKNAASYFNLIAHQKIVLDRAERRALIVQQITELAAAAGGTIPANDALLDEVTNLVEAPTSLVGTFEDQYLVLPRDVLVTVMAKKQRYFPVQGADGKLLPRFITVRNGDDQHIDKVTHGNEQVLRARFSDATYFFTQDIQKTLADFLPRLSTLTFHEKLGSMLDKNQRVEKLVAPVAALLGISGQAVADAGAAAKILKADLATQVVVEMTSLQGTMGREYALRGGASPAVANAIFEHWLPRGADDILPESEAGVIAAIADRLDSLTGLFGAGLAPQSTADPYGLRRAALGIILIAVRKGIALDLRKAINAAADAQPIPVSAETRAQLLEFFAGRLRSWLDDQGFAPDVLAAVLAEQSANPTRALQGIRELSAWTAREDWTALLDGFARCVRITRGEKETFAVDGAAFTEPAEKALYAAWQKASAALTAESGVNDFLSAFAPMLPAVTQFFTDVMVNAEDAAVRRNRIALLQAISALQSGRADMSLLSGF
ncbi:MAG: glycine--tRNA ligase subunit beta [Pleurocapsa minor GSE-CHR-MK-17-07R]|jgi:glycyl-tRNA synthetase|nr:glycine--tRNA ligase subunit beta [Pleurocapsa minor GSE-CHR-MK 17-07R]